MQTQVRGVNVQPDRVSTSGGTLCKQSEGSESAGLCQAGLTRSPTNARSMERGIERGERKAMSTTLYIEAHPSRCCFLRYYRVAL